MGILDLLKKKIKFVSILATKEELKGVLALTVLEPPKGARYRIGDIIHTAATGSALGNFKVYGVKAGGYGFAYVVLDEETLTPYCLKTSRNRFFEEPGGVDQFKREAETWIRLGKHPNLVYAHSVMNIAGQTHILLEYVGGSDLWRKIKNGPMPVSVALNYAIQFCRGMAGAQKVLPGFVHGDIKPNNCLLTPEDTLKITDFGQVNVWAGHQVLPKIPDFDTTSSAPSDMFDTPISHWRAGTPPYMAPEQFDRSTRTDVRSDIYSFGVMLFEMLTGARPFPGKKHEECFAQHRNAIVPDPVALNADIPRPLANLILRCLAKAPAERPADFNFLENELSFFLSNIYQEKVAPVTPEELTDEEMINRALSFMALDYYDEALACLDGVLSVKPRFARVWTHKGDVLTKLGRYAEALECFDRALSLDQQLAFAWGKKGETLDKWENQDEALVCFDRALDINPQLAFVWNDKGHIFINSAQFEQSLECLNRALAIDPRHVEAYINRGITYHELGRSREAIEEYHQALRLNPRYAEAHYNLGNTYSHLWRNREAIESYRQAISFKPDFMEARCNLGDAYRQFYSTSRQFVGEAFSEKMIAFLLADQHDPEIIVSSCIDFLRVSKFDPAVFYLCGSKLYQALEGIQRQQEEALMDILSRVRDNICSIGQDSISFYWLGKIYYGLNRYDECLQTFQQSIEFFGPDDKACYYIAACNEIKGNHAVALDHYKQTLIFDPACLLTMEGIRRMEAELALQSVL